MIISLPAPPKLPLLSNIILCSRPSSLHPPKTRASQPASQPFLTLLLVPTTRPYPCLHTPSVLSVSQPPAFFDCLSSFGEKEKEKESKTVRISVPPTEPPTRLASSAVFLSRCLQTSLPVSPLLLLDRTRTATREQVAEATDVGARAAQSGTCHHAASPSFLHISSPSTTYRTSCICTWVYNVHTYTYLHDVLICINLTSRFPRPRLDYPSAYTTHVYLVPSLYPCPRDVDTTLHLPWADRDVAPCALPPTLVSLV